MSPVQLFKILVDCLTQVNSQVNDQKISLPFIVYKIPERSFNNLNYYFVLLFC